MTIQSWLASFLLLVFAASASAAVSERDWENAPPGNGLLTFDDVNNREWLDLSETILDQFPGATGPEKIQSVVKELNPGGMFEGFTIANSNDVIALAQSAGISTSTFDFNTNQDATKYIIELLSPTIVLSSSRFATIGAIDETGRGRLFSAFSFDERGTGRSTAGLGISPGIEGTLAQAGVMLYRVIPEPDAVMLFVKSSLLLLGVYRSRRR